MDTTALLSADDLFLPELAEPDLPHELWRGELRLVTPASGPHGAVCSRLLGAMAQHVYPRNLGALFTEGTPFLLERGPDTVLCPDVAFVARERLPPGGLAGRFMELAPDLAIEVLSPGDRPAEVRAKAAAYLRLGVRAVWVLDPRVRAVRTRACVGRRIIETTLTEGDTLDGGEVLPGFRVPVAFLFADVRR